MGAIQRPAHLAALVALAVCGGCWEEIHYAPPTETPNAADVNSDPEAPPEDAVIVDTPTEPPPGAPVMLEEPAAEPPSSDAPITLP